MRTRSLGTKYAQICPSLHRLVLDKLKKNVVDAHVQYRIDTH